MDFSAATLWWAAAGVAVVLELLSGTIYLLMVALGLAFGALAAHLGFSSSGQLVVAAVVGTLATLVWHRLRSAKPDLPPSLNPDVNLDVGQQVHVERWEIDGSTRVAYRGSHWSARLAPASDAALAPSPPQAPGTYRIAALDGSQLILEPLPKA